jgi:hypothetical protein
VITSFATVERQAADMQRQIHELRQVRDAAKRPPKTAVELASDCGLALDSWQARALSTDACDVLLLASRQAGKSTVAAIAALHQAITVPGSLVVIVSPSERQSKRLLRSIRGLYYRLPEPVPARHVGILSLEFANGSEVFALPGSESTIRGFSAVNLLILDEAARIEDTLYEATRPMLAVSNGKLIALSTPFGRRGWYFDAWENGQGWHRELVTAHDCPRINPDWLQRERDRIGAWVFNQEYLCQFVANDDQLFSDELITAALSDAFEPFFMEGRAA